MQGPFADIYNYYIGHFCGYIGLLCEDFLRKQKNLVKGSFAYISDSYVGLFCGYIGMLFRDFLRMCRTLFCGYIGLMQGSFPDIQDLYRALLRIYRTYIGLFCGCIYTHIASLILQVSFAEYSLFYRALLQKRPIILRNLLQCSCWRPTRAYSQQVP